MQRYVSALLSVVVIFCICLSHASDTTPLLPAPPPLPITVYLDLKFEDEYLSSGAKNAKGIMFSSFPLNYRASFAPQLQACLKHAIQHTNHQADSLLTFSANTQLGHVMKQMRILIESTCIPQDPSMSQTPWMVTFRGDHGQYLIDVDSPITEGQVITVTPCHTLATSVSSNINKSDDALNSLSLIEIASLSCSTLREFRVFTESRASSMGQLHQCWQSIDFLLQQQIHQMSNDGMLTPPRPPLSLVEVSKQNPWLQHHLIGRFGEHMVKVVEREIRAWRGIETDRWSKVAQRTRYHLITSNHKVKEHKSDGKGGKGALPWTIKPILFPQERTTSLTLPTVPETFTCATVTNPAIVDLPFKEYQENGILPGLLVLSQECHFCIDLVHDAEEAGMPNKVDTLVDLWLTKSKTSKVTFSWDKLKKKVMQVATQRDLQYPLHSLFTQTLFGLNESSLQEARPQVDVEIDGKFHQWFATSSTTAHGQIECFRAQIKFLSCPPAHMNIHLFDCTKLVNGISSIPPLINSLVRSNGDYGQNEKETLLDVLKRHFKDTNIESIAKSASWTVKVLSFKKTSAEKEIVELSTKTNLLGKTPSAMVTLNVIIEPGKKMKKEEQTIEMKATKASLVKIEKAEKQQSAQPLSTGQPSMEKQPSSQNDKVEQSTSSETQSSIRLLQEQPQSIDTATLPSDGSSLSNTEPLSSSDSPTSQPSHPISSAFTRLFSLSATDSNGNNTKVVDKSKIALTIIILGLAFLLLVILVYLTVVIIRRNSKRGFETGRIHNN